DYSGDGSQGIIRNRRRTRKRLDVGATRQEGSLTASHHEHWRPHMLPMRSSRPGPVPGRGRRGRARALVIAAATATALVALAAPAWVNITVTPETAPA